MRAVGRIAGAQLRWDGAGGRSPRPARATTAKTSHEGLGWPRGTHLPGGAGGCRPRDGRPGHLLHRGCRPGPGAEPARFEAGAQLVANWVELRGPVMNEAQLGVIGVVRKIAFEDLAARGLTKASSFGVTMSGQGAWQPLTTDRGRQLLRSTHERARSREPTAPERRLCGEAFVDGAILDRSVAVALDVEVAVSGQTLVGTDRSAKLRVSWRPPRALARPVCGPPTTNGSVTGAAEMPSAGRSRWPPALDRSEPDEALVRALGGRRRRGAAPPGPGWRRGRRRGRAWCRRRGPGRRGSTGGRRRRAATRRPGTGGGTRRRGRG
jgi:hypothetical protein